MKEENWRSLSLHSLYLSPWRYQYGCWQIPLKPFLPGLSPPAGFTHGCSIPVFRRNLDSETTGLKSGISIFCLLQQWVQAPKLILFLEWCPVFTFLTILPWACWSITRKVLSACFRLQLWGKKTGCFGRACLARCILYWVGLVYVFVLVQAIWGHFSKIQAPLWSGPSPSAHFAEGLLAKKLSGDNTYSFSGWAWNGDLLSWLKTIGLFFQAEIILWDHHKPVGSWCCSHCNSQNSAQTDEAGPTVRNIWLLAIF